VARGPAAHRALQQHIAGARVHRADHHHVIGAESLRELVYPRELEQRQVATQLGEEIERLVVADEVQARALAGTARAQVRPRLMPRTAR
jgi:hypothetical protein